jgi:hypothetical protein
MDDQNAGAKQEAKDLKSHPPVQADLSALCRELNLHGAKYIVVGDFAALR